MKELFNEDLLNILGGLANENHDKCIELQHESEEFDKDDPRWEDWMDRFYKECVEGNQGDF